jgi:hypothetical protein
MGFPVQPGSRFGRTRSSERIEIFQAFRQLKRHEDRSRVAREIGAQICSRHGRWTYSAPDPTPKAAEFDLMEMGVLRLGRVLDDKAIAEIISYMSIHFCRDFYRPHLGEFRFDQPPDEAHIGDYDWAPLLSAPHLLALAASPRIVAIVEAYLGARATLSDFGLWWSYPRTAGRESQLFHRDSDDIKFCKLFIYLTPVCGLEAGPHIFVKGSPRIDKCTERRRYSDQEIEAAFGADAIKPILGGPGEAFLADTWGVHKGMVPTGNQPRLIFMAQYSLLPIMRYDYLPRQMESSGLGSAYFSRLFVGSG